MTEGVARRGVLAALAGGAALAAAPTTAQRPEASDVPLPDGKTDRAYMLGLLDKMASPVLDRMARGKLQAEWKLELSPTWDGRDPKVGYLEGFGRLIDGISKRNPPADPTIAEPSLAAMRWTSSGSRFVRSLRSGSKRMPNAVSSGIVNASCSSA